MSEKKRPAPADRERVLYFAVSDDGRWGWISELRATFYVSATAREVLGSKNGAPFEREWLIESRSRESGGWCPQGRCEGHPLDNAPDERPGSQYWRYATWAEAREWAVARATMLCARAERELREARARADEAHALPTEAPK